MDKLVNYEKLSEFKDNLLNDSVASPKATWSSKKITTHLNTELASYATNASLATKQDILTVGTNIEISGTTISATYQTASTAEIEALFV